MKKPKHQPFAWANPWYWSKMIEVLASEDPQVQLDVAKQIVRLQRSCFRKLRKAIESPDSSTNWESPFLATNILFPVDWGSGIELTANVTRSVHQRRDLYVALECVTAGRILEIEDDGLLPQCAGGIRDRIPGAEDSALNRYVSEWIDEKWQQTALCGDDSFLPPDEDYSIRATGLKAGCQFDAALFFHVAPRLVVRDAPHSAFQVHVGLPWVASESCVPPEDWSEPELQALWQVIDEFFVKLSRARRPENLPEKIEKRVSGSRNVSCETIGVRFRNRHGVLYLDKGKPQPIDQDPAFARFPNYVVAGRGPVLAISNGSGELRSDARSIVEAVMLYPCDAENRARLTAQATARQMTKVSGLLTDAGHSPDEHWPCLVNLFLEEGALTHETFRLLSGPWSTEALNQRVLAGAAVGDMFLFLVQCATHHPEHASVRKAVFVTARSYVKAKDASGNPVKYGESGIKDSWGSLKSVAHFWAVFRQWNRDEITAAFDGTSSDDFVEFLKWAEWMRRAGESTFARGRKKKGGPVLDPCETWRVPEDLQLPWKQMTPPPLSEKYLRWLEKDYRPKK